MQLSTLVATSGTVAATRSRTAKVAELAALLREAVLSGSREVTLVTAFLSGRVPHGRLGVGYRTLATLPPPADTASLTVADVDAAFTTLATAAGPGSVAVRRDALTQLFEAATADERDFLAGLVTGEVRQGALDGVMQLAVAEAAGVPLEAVRRAAMLAGRLDEIAPVAMSEGEAGLNAISLQVLRPVSPMLASSATSISEAFAGEGPWDIGRKLDGIRIQAHKHGSKVRVFTRSLDNITDRLPEVVEVIAALPANSLVVDGEAIALRPDGRPEPFQITGARTASTKDPAQLRAQTPLTTYLFDLLHLDGRSLLDEPLTTRLDLLGTLAMPANTVESVVTDDPTIAEAFFADQLAAGHEGVVIKSLTSPYAAGRRGGAWVKVKPRHTLDLVVLAVERGSGRRRGTLSNIHLGARSGDGFVMLGKTFKGMTDEMLAWQTTRFTELATSDDGWVVTVRPEQVVEIAFDGLQRSSRYPGGLALRFARVLRYRDDKTAAQADTLEAVRSLAGAAGPFDPAAPD
ncbi:MAG: ATP-dependent DNA ligase [Propionibacteriaceae bacterium]|nr:ATP-dependent DNA ligase [Micropruina sp.]HBX82174.1 ATP-dependent DNA ligase [Propionibacteriaceae bacterium]HBY21954.1 ATP-dependent DNA ligase [Propionibacteriaceae bacterium]